MQNNIVMNLLDAQPAPDAQVCTKVKRHTRTNLSPAAASVIGVVPTAVVVGCGGTGWHVAKALVLSDMCSTVYLVDYDRIEALNLNRLDVPAEYIGTPKCTALCKELLRVRPESTIVPVEERLCVEDISQYISDDDLVWVFDCTDSALFQRSLSKACIEQREAGAALVYTRVSYNGLDHLTIASKTSGRILTGGDTGYEIVPSWSMPAQLAAIFGTYYAVVQTALLFPSWISVKTMRALVPVIRVSTHYHPLFDCSVLPKETV